MCSLWARLGSLNDLESVELTAGIILFFDGPLLALGNVSLSPAPRSHKILFLSGLPLIIGPTRTFYFFSRKEKWRGTVCFFLGM